VRLLGLSPVAMGILAAMYTKAIEKMDINTISIDTMAIDTDTTTVMDTADFGKDQDPLTFPLPDFSVFMKDF
jgi:hypothetical protein